MVLRQLWRDLLFLHQPSLADSMRRLVPRQLDIDTFEGQAWATLIPLSVNASRPVGVPDSLGIGFLETNLRTYVRSPEGEAGISFFSLEASSWLAVAGARLAYGLPYFPARMDCRKEPNGTTFHYRSERLGSRSGARLNAIWRVAPPLPGSGLGRTRPGLCSSWLVGAATVPASSSSAAPASAADTIQPPPFA